MPEEDNLLGEMSPKGILLDCPPKPLSQPRAGIGWEWTDTVTLISITQGQDTIYIMGSLRTEGNQPWESGNRPEGKGVFSAPSDSTPLTHYLLMLDLTFSLAGSN